MKTVFENAKGMLFYEENAPFGSLIEHQGRVYDPSHGQVDVDPGLVDAHNEALDVAYIEGLDKNCEIGQCGFFYFDGKGNRVTTFIGHVVSDDVRVRGKVITFWRKGKTYRGRLCDDADSFRFHRVA